MPSLASRWGGPALKLDRTSIIAILIFFVVVVLWNAHLEKKYPHYNNPQANDTGNDTLLKSQGRSNNKANSSAVDADAGFDHGTGANSGNQHSVNSYKSEDIDTNTDKEPAIKKLARQDLSFANEHISFELNQSTAGFSSIVLKDFYYSNDKLQNVDLVVENFYVQALSYLENISSKPWHAIRSNEFNIEFYRFHHGYKITQRYEFPKSGYLVNLSVSFENISAKDQNLITKIVMQDVIRDNQAKSFFAAMPKPSANLVAVSASGVSSQKALDACEDISSVSNTKITGNESNNGNVNSNNNQINLFQSVNETVYVLGIDTDYFLKTFIGTNKVFNAKINAGDASVSRVSKDFNNTNSEFNGYAAKSSADYLRGSYHFAVSRVPNSLDCRYLLAINQNFGILPQGQSQNIELSMFFGPKDYRLVKDYDAKLRETIDFGILSFLAHPLLYVLHLFYDLCGNYGLSIILLTILLKILFFPLTKSAAVSMAKNKYLQPEITKIRQQYKDDLRMQQQKIMAFMAKNKINPMKGCLPILPQMPVFFALYRVLSSAVELRHAEFFGWIVDLSAKDPFYITPIVLGVFMFIQQKISMQTTSMDAMQKKIFMWIPVIFAVMMIGFPSGMAIYMLSNTIISILQQLYLNKTLNLVQKSDESLVAKNNNNDKNDDNKNKKLAKKNQNSHEKKKNQL